jgi:hypothetical protein
MNIIDILSIDSNLYDELEDKHSIMDKMADYLLNNCILVINNNNYRLAELEFYLKDADHDDIFIHGDENQHIPYRWYFHKQFGGNYKSGTYKGLDITFGYNDDEVQINNDVYGGILIRSIVNMTTNEIIEGPCKVVNKILELNNVNSIDEFVISNLEYENQDRDDILKIDCNNLHLEINNDLDNLEVISCPRVGLTLKRINELRQEYIMKNYRYIIYPKLIKKFRSGIIINLYYQGKREDDIMDITGSKIRYIMKYIKYAKEGEDTDFKNYHKKSLKSIELCMLQGLCNVNYDL